MQQTIDQLLSFGNDRMANGGGAAVTKMKNAAVDQVNRNYMSMPSRLSSQFASRGYGSSGNFGNTLYDTEFHRQGDLSGLESQFAGMGLNEQNFGAGLNSQLLNFGKGQTTKTVGPNLAAAGGFMSGGNALNNLSQLLMFSNVLKNPGSAPVASSGGEGYSTPGMPSMTPGDWGGEYGNQGGGDWTNEGG